MTKPSLISELEAQLNAVKGGLWVQKIARRAKGSLVHVEFTDGKQCDIAAAEIRGLAESLGLIQP